MFRHYFTFAFRNLWRNKFHSFINILGLAIGVSACLVIYLIVSYELSFNKNIPNYDRIYRVHSKFSGSYVGLNRGAPTAISPYMKDNFKGVENVSLFFIFGSKVQIPKPNEIQKLDEQNGVVIAGEDYFKVLSFYQWLVGSPQVLTKPNQVVLTEAQAKKYFGNISLDKIIGKQVIYQDSLETTVAGIVADVNLRTDFYFTDFISMPTIEATSWLNKYNYRLDDWQSTNSSTQIFVKAQMGTTHQQLLDQLPQLSKIYNEKNTWAKNDFNVQPLSDLHFNAETGIFDNSRSPAHRNTLYALGAVAILLLVIGAINFINLETAQAVRRAKEIGVRKVMGSTRTRLVAQFLCESILVTFISVLLSLPLTELSLKFFSEFVPSGVTLNLLAFIPFLIVVVVFIGLLSSSYPAFVLSSFLPALVLKNQAYAGTSQSRTSFLRKSLIVFQFTFAQVLILGTLAVGWQVRYLLNKDLGFKKDAAIYFTAPWWEDNKKVSVLKTELESVPEIQELSMSNQPPAYNGWSSSTIEYNNGKENLKVNAYRKFGDTSYLHFYGMTLLAGRNLLPSDSVRELIINETLAKQLGFMKPHDAVEKIVKYNDREYPIVGVVKDFHFQSLHHTVEPVMMGNEMKDFRCFNIKVVTANENSEALKSSLDKIEKAWKKIYPDTPFEYKFLDDTVRNFYQTEQRTVKLTSTAMALAIFISCLGLFSLASYTAVQRTKEVGVRKVLGASVQQIVFLLSKDFLLLVLISFVVASPIAWYVINQWLNSFPYRTELNVAMFLLTALIAVVVAFITVSYQTFKTANANPVDSLRSE